MKSHYPSVIIIYINWGSVTSVKVLINICSNSSSWLNPDHSIYEYYWIVWDSPLWIGYGIDTSIMLYEFDAMLIKCSIAQAPHLFYENSRENDSIVWVVISPNSVYFAKCSVYYLLKVWCPHSHYSNPALCGSLSPSISPCWVWPTDSVSDSSGIRLSTSLLEAIVVVSKTIDLVNDLCLLDLQLMWGDV